MKKEKKLTLLGARDLSRAPWSAFAVVVKLNTVAQETFVASLGPFFQFLVDLGNTNINIVQKKAKKRTWDSRRNAPRVPSPVVAGVVLPLLFLPLLFLLMLMRVVVMVVRMVVVVVVNE